MGQKINKLRGATEPGTRDENILGEPGTCEQRGPTSSENRSRERGTAAAEPASAVPVQELTDAISPSLRMAYADLLNKPVPERFVKLLQELAAQHERGMEPNE